MDERDSTSGPALKYQEVQVVAVTQMVTSVILPTKGKNKITKSDTLETYIYIQTIRQEK